jgi:hypothetical protein
MNLVSRHSEFWKNCITNIKKTCWPKGHHKLLRTVCVNFDEQQCFPRNSSEERKYFVDFIQKLQLLLAENSGGILQQAYGNEYCCAAREKKLNTIDIESKSHWTWEIYWRKKSINTVELKLQNLNFLLTSDRYLWDLITSAEFLLTLPTGGQTIDRAFRLSNSLSNTLSYQRIKIPESVEKPLDSKDQIM